MPCRIRLAFLVACAVLLAGCASLPTAIERTPSFALDDTAATRLGRAIAPRASAHPGKSGVHAMPDPRDAFATRVLLAAAAERSLDLQYYIWHDDIVGDLLFEALWRAAERGVRVRLLLDDLNTKGLDPTLAALDAHPNIEVRLYNPFVQRHGRALAFLADFARLNRRMHNKSFTADNQVSVVGGRNVGDEYFGAGHGVLFADLDVIAIGDGVHEVSKEFDAYWNSASAYPATPFVGAAGPDARVLLEGRFEAARADPDGRAYIEAVRSTPIVRDILGNELAFEWTTAKVIYDDPGKTADTEGVRRDVLLFPELVRAMGRPQASVDLVTPYFVPGENGADALAALAHRGVLVRILTNSLSSSDAAVVHAGYAKRRTDLLRAGVKLYELKSAAAGKSDDDRQGVGSSGAAALHAKTFAVDRERIFVGSFNFDQRSAHLNTEMGLVIESRSLATRLSDTFDRVVPLEAYEVRLSPDGDLYWIERTAAGEVRHDIEPATSAFLRWRVRMMSMLPIDWML